MRLRFEFEATLSRLRIARGLVQGFCAPDSPDPEELHLVVQAVDEAIANAVVHAYEGRGDGTITLDCELAGPALTVRVSERGRAFDFDPNVSFQLERHMESGRKGGLGLHLIRMIADRVEYSTSDGVNTLTFHRRLGGGTGRQAA